MHPQGIEEFPLQNSIPLRNASRLRNDSAGQKMRDVGVGEGGPKARHRIDMAQGMDQRRLFETDHAQRVVRVGRKPGALSKQIEYPELAGHPRILQLKFRVEVNNAVVPPEFATVHHEGQRRGKKSFGG
jgi:hypothetical protein